MLTRRAFSLTLTAGLTAAFWSADAAKITTDAIGLMAGDIQIPVSDGVISGYRAAPATGRHHATVLVVHEIFGLDDYTKDVCRRLAKSGYYTIAADLFSRKGNATDLADKQAELLKFLSEVRNAQVMSDMDAAVAFAKSENADTARLGVTGFFWGGVRVWLYTATNPNVRAGVSWHGPLVRRADAPVTGDPSPIDVAAQIKGRMLGLYAGLDMGMAPQSREQMLDALKAAGDTQSRIVVYPDARQGFYADYRPSYDEAAAKDGWAQMLTWFQSHGVA